MKNSINLIVLLTILAGCDEPMQKQSTLVEIPEDKIASITTAEKLGRMIYEKDQYAAIATDIMLEKIPNPEEKGIVGWITVTLEDRAEVIFIKSQQGQFTAFCQIIFESNKRPYFIQNERSLSEQETAMFRTQQHASEIIKQYCTDKYNTVVLPTPDGQGWFLYALAASTDTTTIIAGGHYRATISLDGKTILSQRSFTNTCLQIPLPPDMPVGAKPVAYALTHLLDDTPTEIHVFLSLLYKMPCCVATKDGKNWFVENGKITLMKQTK